MVGAERQVQDEAKGAKKMKNTARMVTVTGITILCLMFTCATARAQSEMEGKDILVGEISKIRQDNPDFKIRLKPVSKVEKFRVGDRMAFEVTSNKDAYLTIIDVGTSGKAHVIFPNRWNRDNKIRKGKTYRIPGSDADYSFKLTGRPGVNYVKAIATLEPTRILPRDLDADVEEGFAEIRDLDKTAKDIIVELGKQGKKSWAETEAKFTVHSRHGEDGEEGELEPITERRSNKFNATLRTDKKSYRIGESVSFHFFSEHDCYLNLVDYGAGGKVRLIFPNRLQNDNFVKGGRVFTIPSRKEDEFHFKVKGPVGTERVEAFVTSRKVKLHSGSYGSEKSVYHQWDEEADTVRKDIQVQLDDVPDDLRSVVKTSFEVRPNGKGPGISKDIMVERIRESGSVTFGEKAILFGYGSADLLPASHAQLMEVADFIRDPQVADIPFFYVDGHTCNIGTDERNCKLSRDRAWNVVRFLVEKAGVPSEKLKARGFGKNDPEVDNDTDENRQKNRRVVLKSGTDSSRRERAKICDDE
jgi:outer membrane protein OmpA-like peptidoglycan-associated protein